MAAEKPLVQTIDNSNRHDGITTTQPINAADADVELEEGELKKPVDLQPKAEDQLEALGIPNWRELERKVVRRLDMTLMPCLWCVS